MWSKIYFHIFSFNKNVKYYIQFHINGLDLHYKSVKGLSLRPIKILLNKVLIMQIK